MSPTIKKLDVTYNPINESNTFTSGDFVSGEVTVEVDQECQIDSLSIKFKGKAEVLWTERHGQTTHTYHSKDKYFSFKHYFVQDRNHRVDDEQMLLGNLNLSTYSNVIPAGFHVYPFTFQIPPRDLPSTFKGSVGKIVYLLEVSLGRPMRLNKKESKKIQFVTRPEQNLGPELMVPQHESKNKKMSFFNSGTVAMDVDIEKTGFCQGEGVKVSAYIKNNSSREIKPKYCIYRKHSFFARGKRRLDTKDLLKEVGENIPPSTERRVTRIITIPHDVEPSILNCSILKVEYRIRVYLDVKYASDPQIKFNIVILPASQVHAVAPPPGAAAAAAFGFGFEPYGNPNPPVWDIGETSQPSAEPQPSDPPPSYEAHSMYPPFRDFGFNYK